MARQVCAGQSLCPQKLLKSCGTWEGRWKSESSSRTTPSLVHRALWTRVTAASRAPACWGCCNTAPHLGGLMETYCSESWRLRVRDPGVCRGDSFWGLGGRLFGPPPWLIDGWLLTSPSLSLFMCWFVPRFPLFYHIGLEPTLMTSLSLHFLCRDPISK